MRSLLPPPFMLSAHCLTDATCGEIIVETMGLILRGLAFIAVGLSLAASIPVSAKPIQIYGVWHCGSDLCGWDNVPEMNDFDIKNHWLIDRGDGKPSVNLVVLSFVDPLRLLNLTNDAHNVNGIPIGITPEIVSYFTSHRTRVMISIGGYLRQGLGPSACNESKAIGNKRRASRTAPRGRHRD